MLHFFQETAITFMLLFYLKPKYLQMIPIYRVLTFDDDRHFMFTYRVHFLNYLLQSTMAAIVSHEQVAQTHSVLCISTILDF